MEMLICLLWSRAASLWRVLGPFQQEDIGATQSATSWFRAGACLLHGYPHIDGMVTPERLHTPAALSPLTQWMSGLWFSLLPGVL